MRALRVLAALGLLACALPVFAHAFLDHAAPAVGSSLRGSPAVVTLWFTQELEPAFSSVRVLDASGRQIDRRDAKVDAQDRTLLTVSLPPLAPGTYRVAWRVLSVDAHVTEGDFSFDVAP
jgi:methionine-rich copper-binding protein CopC